MDVTELKNRKKQTKMTLQQISDLSGVPKPTVDDLFSGKTKNPRFDTIEAIRRALGLTERPATWTEQEKSLGVGNHPTYLSDKEWDWLELRSELLRVMGEDYLNTVELMLQAIIDKK